MALSGLQWSRANNGAETYLLKQPVMPVYIGGGGNKRRQVKLADVLRAAVENGGVRGVIEGVYGFARRQKITGKRPDFAVAVRVGMRHDHGGGQIGDDAVASHGRFFSGADEAGLERGDDQQPAFIDGGTAVNRLRGDALEQAAGQAPDNRMGRTEQDAQALLLHRRMEAADDGDALLAEQLGEVVGVEDELAGTLFRAQQRDHGPVKDGGVAHASYYLTHGVSLRLLERSHLLDHFGCMCRWGFASRVKNVS